MSSTGLAEAVVRKIDWTHYLVSSGDAGGFGGTLLQLLSASGPAEAREVWNGIENHVFSQDDIFSAAEPTVDVILAALVEDRPSHVRVALVDLLFLLLHGNSDHDPELQERCRKRALRGMWLLAREATAVGNPVREAFLEILDLIDPVQAEELRDWFTS